jgi:endonuclease G
MQSERASLESSERAQQAAAEGRFARRAVQRRKQIATLLEPGGLARADTPERVAKRVDRVSRYLAGERAPTTQEELPSGNPDEVLRKALARAAPEVGLGDGPETAGTPAATAGVVLEAIINTSDFVGVRFLEAGARAARAVGRVDIRDENGVDLGWGTGSMVGPRLLLTNHQVLEDAEVARRSAIEFDFEDGLDGQPRQPRVFALDPDLFFLADDDRDFALVAVAATEQQLAPYGFNRLIEVEGKAIIGDFVTIVQHPGERKKQVALRENRVVDVVDAFLHYEADTEPGSSGSPVFNDQWEIAALHHASVPAPGHGELGNHMNEGIRVSRILEFVRQPHGLSPEAQALLASLAVSERIVVGRRPADAAAHREGNGSGASNGERTLHGASAVTDTPRAVVSAAPQGRLQLTIPLEITLAVGSPVVAGGGDAPSAAVLAPAPWRAAVSGQEAVKIDPDYAARRGYDADFLGAGHRVDLPSLPPELAAIAATREDATGADAHVLRYHHYSVVMNAQRRLAFFTAVNIDGERSVRIKRERDRWIFDPRLPEAEQTGERVYEDNPLDRGHLVRRLDPAWGGSHEQAKVANDDTFHFTNCTPSTSASTRTGRRGRGLRTTCSTTPTTATSGPACSPARSSRPTTRSSRASSCRASSGRSR